MQAPQWRPRAAHPRPGDTIPEPVQPPSGRAASLVRAPQRLFHSGAGLARKVTDIPAKLPSGVQEEIKKSAKRLTRVRSLKSAKAAVIEEAERLFVAVTPLLAAAPLPVTGWRARLAAGGAGGVAAVMEQAEELAALTSWGGALPGAPVVAVAVLSAWLLELWVAVSARVAQLRAAGRQVDPETLSRELACAYLGDPDAIRRDGMTRIGRAVALRAAERWSAGLVPGVGIAFDTFASQRTVARILREPLNAHPLAPLGPHRAIEQR